MQLHSEILGIFLWLNDYSQIINNISVRKEDYIERCTQIKYMWINAQQILLEDINTYI